MRLALCLGRTLAEVCETMTSAELTLWLARETVEPLPDPWLQTGVSTAACVNLWSKTPVRPRDFIPLASPPRAQRMSGAQLAAAMALVPGVMREYGEG